MDEPAALLAGHKARRFKKIVRGCNTAPYELFIAKELSRLKTCPTQRKKALVEATNVDKGDLGLKTKGYSMSAKLFCLAAAAALVCGPAFAADSSVATLGAVKGSVLVSQGGKMVQAGAASLKTGDRIVASTNGSAVVKFADGCTISLKPASMITVATKSPCASGAGLISATQAQPREFFGVDNGTAILLGVVGVAAIVAIVDQSDDSNKASPTGSP